MNKTKIEWADSTWNPVSGCLNGCSYCYARRIAERFGGASETHHNECVGTECQWLTEATGELHDMQERLYDCDRGRYAPYPFEFDPTMYRYKLDIPQRWQRPRTIFVCSMADLFGPWVPDEWIEAVFAACQAAPRHRYMFLTKHPDRLCELADAGKLPDQNNFWYGTTITGKRGLYFDGQQKYNTFISVEPLLERLYISLGSLGGCKLIIIGAQTGGRGWKKTAPKKEWIDEICEAADITRAAVFMKDSLIPIVGEEGMRRQLPWR